LIRPPSSEDRALEIHLHERTRLLTSVRPRKDDTVWWQVRDGVMADVSLSIAFVGGGLATLNPCGFPLLPAFLSFYAGADETRLPAASTRLAQGTAAGLLVTAGFLGVFAGVGLEGCGAACPHPQGEDGRLGSPIPVEHDAWDG
jgi:thiol:disulfide interchange protein